MSTVLKHIVFNPGKRFFGFLLLLVLMAGFSQLTAQTHHHEQKFDAQKRSDWIINTVTLLENSGDPDMLQKVVVNEYEQEDGLIAFRVRVIKEAWVVFENGDRIHFVCNSSHDDEAVGDVCVAMDQDGNLFVNEGHVCGGLINFEFKGNKAPASAAIFFKDFKSDTDKKTWKTYVKEHHIETVKNK